MSGFECLPGFRDFYPEACAQRNFLFRVWTLAARRFGFQEYDIPTLEPLELLTEKSGPEIVEQLFHFTDKGGREVALRPELTPSLARMVGSQANSLKRPIKWFNIAENFRYEKPQKGRLRSHYQFNADVFGEPGEGADSEIVALCVECLLATGLGANDFRLRLSDRSLWIDFLAALGHEGDAALGILGVVDKMERLPQEAVLEKLEPWFGEAREDFLAQVKTLVAIRDLEGLQKFFGSIASDAKLKERLQTRLQSWERLLGDLDALGVSPWIRIDLGIVRGLAYYTGYVFEVFAIDGEGQYEGRALAGGGRYDHLVGRLGFPEMPAVGFGMGDVMLGQLLQERGKMPPLIDAPDCYLVIGGPAQRAAALKAACTLRAAGYRVEYPLKSVGFGKQFKLAGQSGARLALIFGEEEVAAGTAKLRNLQSGDEQSVPIDRLLDAVAEA